MAEHWNFHSVGAFSVSHSAPPVNRLGVRKRLGGDTTRQMTQTDQRDIPCHITSCFAMKKGEEGILEGLAIFCSGTGWASVYPWEVVSDRLCITSACFLSSSTRPLLIKQFLSWCTSFLAFTRPLLFRCPTGGQEKWASSCVVLHCLPGLTHNKDKKLTESENIKKCDS